MKTACVRPVLIAAVALLASLVIARAAAQPCPPAWVPGDPASGVDGPVYASITHNDGSGASLFVAGDFGVAGNVRAKGVARWDGIAWHAVGSGSETTIRALAVRNGELYAGSSLAGPVDSSAVSRWDGHSWKPVPTGRHTLVSAMTTFNGDLIVGGRVFSADGKLVGAIARWNGKAWSAVGPGSIGGIEVRALFVLNGSLFAGGRFTLPNPTRQATIARFDGATWTIPGAGLNGPVYALGAYHGELIATGTFDNSGQTPVNGVARWDGAQWRPLADGLGLPTPGFGGVSLAVYGKELYVGGIFDLTGRPRFCDGKISWSLARWDGSCWRTAGDNPFYSVFSISTFGARLFVAGYQYGGSGACALWDSRAWSSTIPGTDGPITAAVTYQGALVVGGQFNSIGSAEAQHVAVRRDDQWEPLGEGSDVPVHALAVYRGRLVAGGSWFYQGTTGRISGGTRAWDGAAWAPLMNGLEYGAAADALLVNGDQLIGAGWFYFSLSQTTSAARWDGRVWHPMGAHDRDLISSLADLNGDVVAAGYFDGHGHGVARWDGLSWVPVGGTLPEFPTSLAIYANELFSAGPGFVGRFDGAEWKLFAEVSPSGKCLLHVHNGALFAAASAVQLNNQPAGNIVRFDGGRGWSSFAGGLNLYSSTSITAAVGALASDGSDLIFGGSFTRAGEMVTASLARLAPSNVADMNLDGFLDGTDTDIFLSAFENGGPGADLNHDGFVDGMDYDLFNNAFEAGC